MKKMIKLITEILIAAGFLLFTFPVSAEEEKPSKEMLEQQSALKAYDDLYEMMQFNGTPDNYAGEYVEGSNLVILISSDDRTPYRGISEKHNCIQFKRTKYSYKELQELFDKAVNMFKRSEAGSNLCETAYINIINNSVDIEINATEYIKLPREERNKFFIDGVNYKFVHFSHGLDSAIIAEKQGACGWNEFDGEKYYIKSNGVFATKSTIIDGIRYKFGKDGVCQGKYTGKVKSGNRIICYKDGVKQDELFTGWLKAGGKRFYAKDGVIRTGWVTVGSGRYYIDPKEGRLPGAERICVKVPDGTVYESVDGGKSWTVDGKKTKTPTLSARFETKRPAVFSEKSVLTIRNETGKEIDFGEIYELFREENGKWIPAEMDGEWSGEDVAYFIESDSERTTDVHTEIHAPIKGKYRYTVNLNDAEGNGYMISVEFWAVEE